MLFANKINCHCYSLSKILVLSNLAILSHDGRGLLRMADLCNLMKIKVKLERKQLTKKLCNLIMCLYLKNYLLKRFHETTTFTTCETYIFDSLTCCEKMI